MLRHRIICVTRASRTEDPHRHPTHAGLGNEGGWSRVMMVEEIIFQLKKGDGDRYFLRGRDGWEAEVKVGRCAFCAKQHEFLVSAPDLTAKDKLMTLPACAD
jgi:hypothetical protein